MANLFWNKGRQRCFPEEIEIQDPGWDVDLLWFISYFYGEQKRILYQFIYNIYIYTDVLRISKTSQAIELVSLGFECCTILSTASPTGWQRPTTLGTYDWSDTALQFRDPYISFLISRCIRFGWFKHHWKWWLSIKWWLGPSFVSYYDSCCCWCFISWALHSVVGYTQEFVLHNLSFFSFWSTQ